jgi:hypothetical protein
MRVWGQAAPRPRALHGAGMAVVTIWCDEPEGDIELRKLAAAVALERLAILGAGPVARSITGVPPMPRAKHRPAPIPLSKSASCVCHTLRAAVRIEGIDRGCQSGDEDGVVLGRRRACSTVSAHGALPDGGAVELRRECDLHASRRDKRPRQRVLAKVGAGFRKRS